MKVFFKNVLLVVFLFIKSVTMAQTGISMWNALEWEGMDFSFWLFPKEVRPLVKKCAYSMEETTLSDKNAKKIVELYEQNCKLNAKNKAFADCVYGNFMLSAKSMIAYRQKGLELMQSGISNQEILGNAATAYFLALLSKNCLTANDIQNHEALAFKFIYQAQELSPAYNEILGYYYLYGIGTTMDIDKGIACLDKHIRRISDNGINSRQLIAPHLNSLYEQKIAAEIYKTSSGTARDLYCEGMKNSILQNPETAMKLFQKAADLGYEPAMYSSSYLPYFMKKDEKGMMLQLAKSGYLPAAYVVAGEKISRTANATFVAQVKKAQAEAYPLFQKLADMQYYPAAYLCVEYSKGTLCKTFAGSVFENVVNDVLGAIGPKGKTGNSVQTNTGTNVRSSAATSKTSANYGLVDITRVQNKEKHYQSMCNHAEHWLKSYHEADAWIKTHESRNMSSSEQTTYKSMLEKRRSAREHLKRSVLPDLQITRKGAADAGGNIPISSIESQISSL